jgi:RNA polymerase sigma-70 factor (ECF subfamily)
LNWLRDRKRASLRERSAETPQSTDAQRMLEARDVLRRLQTMLDRLPPEQRVALVLKELEGRSAREVAELLGITEGALEQRLVRARETLRAGGLR